MAYSPRQQPRSLAEVTGNTDVMRSSPLSVARDGKTDLYGTATNGSSPLGAANAPRSEDNLDPSLRAEADRMRGGVQIVPASGMPPASGNEGVGVGVGAPRPAVDPNDPYAIALAGAEGAVAGLPGALSAARDASTKSYEEQMALYKQGIADAEGNPIKNSMWGQFGAALLQPTSTGSWAEGFGNAASAAMRSRDEYARDKFDRDQKLTASKIALAKMQGEAPNSAVQGLRDQIDVMRASEEVQGYRADYTREIGGGVTPQGDAALIADAQSNPAKYRSERGRALVDAAIERQRSSSSQAADRDWELQKLREQSKLKREEEAAKVAAEGKKITPLDRSEANRVSKRLSEAQVSADDASALKADIANLRMSRDKTGYEGGWGADTWATVGGYVGAPGSAAMQEVRANAEALRLALTQKTKGAISDSEMKIFGLATPGLNMSDDAAKGVLDAQEAAAERSVQKNMFLKSWVQQNGSDYGADEAWSSYVAENPVISQSKDGNILVNKSNVSNWRDYVTGPDGQPASGGNSGAANSQPTVQPRFDVNALPSDVKAWAQRQLDNGIPAAQVIQRLNDHVSKGVK